MPTVREIVKASQDAARAATSAADKVKADQQTLSEDQRAEIDARETDERTRKILTVAVGTVGEVVTDDGTVYQVIGGQLHTFRPRPDDQVTVDVTIDEAGNPTVAERSGAAPENPPAAGGGPLEMPEEPPAENPPAEGGGPAPTGGGPLLNPPSAAGRGRTNR